MSTKWVACSVRARAMMRRRLGRAAARGLAAEKSLDAALVTLSQSPYRRGDVGPDDNLADAQRGVVETVLWNLRVLAGWAPREGVTMLRVLVGIVEIDNVENHLRRLAGGAQPPPYRLGGLATAWPRLARATTADQVRSMLTASPWGDPGGQTTREIGLAMRTSLADRMIAAVPGAGSWAAGAVALLVAQVDAYDDADLPTQAHVYAERVLGPHAMSPATLPEFAVRLGGPARWALADVVEPAELWRAQARWWARVETDGFALARTATAGPQILVGAAATMAFDAWRARAALELAARGGQPMEAFDAVA